MFLGKTRLGKTVNIICKIHGKVEVEPNANGDVYCPKCIVDAVRRGLEDPEKRRQLSEAMKHQSFTCHKPPGTPGFVPPSRPFGETAGIIPLYQETYIRRVPSDLGAMMDAHARIPFHVEDDGEDT